MTALRDPLSLMAERLAELADDPLGYAVWAMPWGRAGSPLEGMEGPLEWQADILEEIGQALRSGQKLIRVAVASGHGIGKSALVGMIANWAMATKANTRGVVTANTEAQLRTKTWPELSKWWAMSESKMWLRHEATSFRSADAEAQNSWRIDAIPWSERNTEAFAGLHNKGRRIILVFDEASAIPDIIWEVAEGALTDADTEIIWIAFGNPTRNTGRFRECFGKFSGMWIRRHIDARTVPITNRALHDEWAEAYGEDSDFFRVRVRGEFPRAGSMQFISNELAETAAKREAHCNPTDPLIMGVDVARAGDDKSVIRFRKGRDARTIQPIKFRGMDTMRLASIVVGKAREFGVDAIFVDGGGVGGPVVDRIRQLGHDCIEVNFGATATDDKDHANKSAEMYARLKTWLQDGGAIDDDRELIEELTGREYDWDDKMRLRLERKKDMKARGLASPDDADGLALTFAEYVAPRANAGQLWPTHAPRHVSDYNPFS